jgi:hypothetical protein
MAYDTGTLMAAGGDVYTQLIALLKTFCESAGWTTNLYGDDTSYYKTSDSSNQHCVGGYAGKRLHMQKSIGGTVRYVNLKTAYLEKPFETFQGTGLGKVSGLAISGSTGFSATQTLTITGIRNQGGSPNRVVVDLASGNPMLGDSVTISGTANYNGTFTIVGAASGYFIIEHAFVSDQTGSAVVTLPWDKQPGYTMNLNGFHSQGASAGVLPLDILGYWLVSSTDGNTIYLILQNDYGYTGIIFGAASTNIFFIAGGYGYGPDSDTVKRNGLLFELGSGYSGMWALLPGGWSKEPSTGTVVGLKLPRFINVNTTLDSAAAEAIPDVLLYCSPDNFKGNAPLIPCYVGVREATGSKKELGVIPNLKYVNMKFLASLTEVTYGGNTYKLFRMYGADDANDATAGLALLIS